MKRLRLETGAEEGAKEYTPPTGPVVLLMPPGAAELLAGGHAAALTGGQESCWVAAIQCGGAASAVEAADDH